jgi:hypothetical protein
MRVTIAPATVGLSPNVSMSMVTGRDRVVFFGGVIMMIGGRVSQKTLQHGDALFNLNARLAAWRTSPFTPPNKMAPPFWMESIGPDGERRSRPDHGSGTPVGFYLIAIRRKQVFNDGLPADPSR